VVRRRGGETWCGRQVGKPGEVAAERWRVGGRHRMRRGSCGGCRCTGWSPLSGSTLGGCGRRCCGRRVRTKMGGPGGRWGRAVLRRDVVLARGRRRGIDSGGDGRPPGWAVAWAGGWRSRGGCGICESESWVVRRVRGGSGGGAPPRGFRRGGEGDRSGRRVAGSAPRRAGSAGRGGSVGEGGVAGAGRGRVADRRPRAGGCVCGRSYGRGGHGPDAGRFGSARSVSGSEAPERKAGSGWWPEREGRWRGSRRGPCGRRVAFATDEG